MQCHFRTIMLGASCLLTAAQAQSGDCSPTWTGGFGLGESASIQAFALLGNGPDRVLYASGSASSVFERTATGSWKPLGGGPIAEVRSLAVFDDGRGPALYATPEAGITADGPAKGIVMWNGSAWENVGGGLGGTALGLSLAVFDDGRGPALYVGGKFQLVGGVPVTDIARWDGSAWSAVGAVSTTGIHALQVFDDGNGPALYAGANQITINGITGNIARWDGAVWTPIGSDAGTNIRAFAVHNHGDGPALYAGGLPTFGSLPVVERFDGRSWSVVGDPFNGNIDALLSFDDGSGAGSQLYAGGTFTQSLTEGGKVPMPRLARWDGAVWSPVDGGTSGSVFALLGFQAEDGPSMLVGGFFASAGDVPSQSIARRRGCQDFAAPCPTDLDGSATIDSADLNLVLAGFGCVAGACAGDVDGDGDTDSADLNALLAEFGSECP